MAGRFVSVPMTLSDRERPDERNQFFFRRILITLVRSDTSLHLHKCVGQFVSEFLVSNVANNCAVKCRRLISMYIRKIDSPLNSTHDPTSSFELIDLPTQHTKSHDKYRCALKFTSLPPVTQICEYLDEACNPLKLAVVETRSSADADKPVRRV